MKIKDFPGCCTAKIVLDFGQSEIAEYGDQLYSVEDIEKYIKTAEENEKAYGRAILVATTNSEQKNANKALRRRGFKSSKWASKFQHPETKVKLWYKCLD